MTKGTKPKVHASFELRVITRWRRMLGAHTYKIPGPFVAPVLLGARAIGATGRGIKLSTQLGLLLVPRLVRLLLLLLLVLVLGRVLWPAPARGLPAHLLQIREQVPLDILPDPGLLSDLLLARIRVHAWP